jgi:molybdenum cofactor biosynthesis enzyme MoaA
MTMFSEMNRLGENLVPATAKAIREAVPNASLGLADLYVCGMNYFPFDPHKVMGALPEVDWVLVGEGEPTLAELLRRLEQAESLEGLPRLAFRLADGRVEWNAAVPEPIEQLDTLAAPAFDLLNMERFFSTQADAIAADLVHEYHVPERQIALMTSRSCPYRCNFCTNQVLGLPWRAHSVDYVRALTRELRERYAVERFLFLDDNINVGQERFRDLVGAMAEEGMAWDAVNGYRADRLDRQMVQAIKRAGNTKITVSAESADPELLQQVIKKGLKLSCIIELARICEEESIPLQVHYIVGVPGETRTQINKTLEFAVMLFETHGAWPLLQHAIPFPGTQLFRDCEEHGWFVAPPFEIPGELLEVESIIRTPQFEPQEVIRMKRNAQHLLSTMQSLVYQDIQSWDPAQLRQRLEKARFLGGTELLLDTGQSALGVQLAALMREARGLGFRRVTLITDATGMSQGSLAQTLVDAGMDAVVVTLHGAEAAMHDAAIGRRGAFSSTVRGVAQALKSGLKTLEVQIPVTRSNLAALPSTVQLALRLRASKIHLQIPTPESGAAKDGQVPCWQQARGPLLDAVRSARRGLVTIQGAPLCLLPEQPSAISPSPHWIMQRLRPQKVKHPECRECVGYILCGGPYRPEFDAAYAMSDLIRNPSHR